MTAAEELLAWLEENRNEKNIEGMARFGIRTDRAVGVPLPLLRAAAKPYRRRHETAMALWESGVHEARILAGLIADPARFGPEDMDAWSAEFDSWDLCDQCCSNLFRHLPYVQGKVTEYVADGREFVRRTGFVLMAVLAVHDKEASDERFLEWLKVVEAYAWDGRNFVKKAVNWAPPRSGGGGRTAFRGRRCGGAVGGARRPAGTHRTADIGFHGCPSAINTERAVGKRFCRGGTAADSVPEADIQTVRTSRCR